MDFYCKANCCQRRPWITRICVAIKIQRACFVMVIFVDLVSRHGLRTTYFVGSALVSPACLKKRQMLHVQRAVSLHGSKNDV